MHGFGSDGKILKPSGKVIPNLVYVILEYVDGMLLFDKCQEMGGFGEDVGCGIMEQLTEVLTYLSEKEICHRDLKLENILVDNDLNLKVTDFGFATKTDIHSLKTYTGSKMYMAPEIEECRFYDGL